jgi:hypothetical protein
MNVAKMIVPSILAISVIAGAAVFVATPATTHAAMAPRPPVLNNGTIRVDRLKRVDRNNRPVVAARVTVELTLQGSGRTWRTTTDGNGNAVFTGLPSSSNGRDSVRFQAYASFNNGEATSRDSITLSPNNNNKILRMPNLRR